MLGSDSRGIILLSQGSVDKVVAYCKTGIIQTSVKAASRNAVHVQQ